MRSETARSRTLARYDPFESTSRRLAGKYPPRPYPGDRARPAPSPRPEDGSHRPGTTVRARPGNPCSTGRPSPRCARRPARVVGACARVNCTLHRCTMVRSGSGMAVTLPGSGRVPAHHDAAPPCSRLTAAPGRCAERPMECFLVTSFAPAGETARTNRRLPSHQGVSATRGLRSCRGRGYSRGSWSP